MKLLVANRGEIALRIIRAARDLSIPTISVHAEDDADSPHASAADDAAPLTGRGPAAYLDGAAIVKAAVTAGATAIHPGYGFLSENAKFAAECADAGLVFVGPSPTVLEMLGDKTAARTAAEAAGVPVLPATAGAASREEVREFLAQHRDGIMIKALSGGGGRGIRTVRDAGDVDDAYTRCVAEAQSGFGDSAVFAEALFDDARHIEVQVVCAPDEGKLRAVAVGDRDCSVQRRHQKLIEIAPAQKLDPYVGRRMHESAVTLCARIGYLGLATVEFLVRGDEFVFLEVNPRIQVEHTVTEEVTGLDLVGTQLAIASGRSFGELDLPEGIGSRDGETFGEPVVGRGIAIQSRVNMETMDADGEVVPQFGTLSVFTVPSGPGVRVDTHGRPGYAPSPLYDSLLAKVIVHARGDDVAVAARKAEAALAEFVVDGVPTNAGFLRAVLADDEFLGGAVPTTYVGNRVAALAQAAGIAAPAVVPEGGADGDVLRAQLTGVVVEVQSPGTTVASGEAVVVLEAMKMQHVVAAPVGLRVLRTLVTAGQVVRVGDPLVLIERVDGGETVTTDGADLDREREDLAEVRSRHEITLDEARPEAVSKRHGIGRRTTRENIADLVDERSFVEYGPLTFAAQRTRRSEEDLIANTPADGLVGGVATVNGGLFGNGAEVVVMSYDYTVLAGTQGMRNHAKTDRLIELAERKRVPLVLFAEGGGGRPGDTDAPTVAGLDVPTFRSLAMLNGKVPLVSVVSGRCFAGNAALAGVCDVLIATPEANIGMGGPAMVEGGGLGTFRPEEIGPIDVQRRNGVVDLVADDERHAVSLAKQYLAYFQGDLEEWTAPDPRVARHVVPENRLRAYDVRAAMESIADVGSVLELRPDHGVGIVTALVRVEGVAYGVVANSSLHLGGAIDAVGADKAARFLAMCQSFALPVVSLCDTPGFMVGPDSETEATVRRFGNLFVAGARLTVPFGTIILRKGYGLGAMAMAGGSFHAADFTVAWPTGEIGAMGLEGAVRLGFRKELEAIEDPVERDRVFGQFVDAAYRHGKAINAATAFELDDVIDPADSRAWIRTLGSRRPA